MVHCSPESSGPWPRPRRRATVKDSAVSQKWNCSGHSSVITSGTISIPSRSGGTATIEVQRLWPLRRPPMADVWDRFLIRLSTRSLVILWGCVTKVVAVGRRAQDRLIVRLGHPASPPRRGG